MDLHISSFATLVPGGACCVFYPTLCQVYLGLSYKVISCYYLIWYHTDKDAKTAQYTQVPLEWHAYLKNIYFNTTSYVVTAITCITLNE